MFGITEKYSNYVKIILRWKGKLPLRNIYAHLLWLLTLTDIKCSLDK